MKYLFILLALGIGTFVSMQPGVNAEIARKLGSPSGAAIVSLVISIVVLLPFVLFVGARPQIGNLATLPWWAVLGGMAGACFVVGAIIMVPVTGTALFLVAIILGQMVGASLVDQFGMFGLPVKPLNLYKMGGLAIMFAGLLLFLRGNFP